MSVHDTRLHETPIHPAQSWPPCPWHGKPYYSLDAYCKNTFHHKCYKVALDAHMTCPNRDGTLDTRGCIFCSAGGSGDYAVSVAGSDIFPKSGVFPEDGVSPGTSLLSRDISVSSDFPTGRAISLQLQAGLALLSPKWDQNRLAVCGQPSVIAYFQAYTNTYAPPPYLEQVFTAALEEPEVCGISIATRPDCLPDAVMELLCSLKERYPGKFIWVELGLQTIHPKTASLIRRGYPLSVFDRAMEKLGASQFPVIVHVILGLPGETPAQMLETIAYLNTRSPFGIKIQLLHVLRGTDLAALYVNGGFRTLAKEEYLDMVITCLEHLSPRIVVHRLTGDGPKRLLIAPAWSSNKKEVLNDLHHLMRIRNTWQGRLYALPEET